MARMNESVELGVEARVARRMKGTGDEWFGMVWCDVLWCGVCAGGQDDVEMGGGRKGEGEAAVFL